MSDFIGRFDFLTDHNYAASSSDNHEVNYMAEDWVFWNLCTLLWNWWEISLDFTRKDKTTLLLVSRSSKLCAKKGWAGLRRPHESGGEQRPCKLHEGPRRRRRHALRTWRHCRRWSCSIAQKIEIGTVSSRTWHGHGESDEAFVALPRATLRSRCIHILTLQGSASSDSWLKFWRRSQVHQIYAPRLILMEAIFCGGAD